MERKNSKENKQKLREDETMQPKNTQEKNHGAWMRENRSTITVAAEFDELENFKFNCEVYAPVACVFGLYICNVYMCFVLDFFFLHFHLTTNFNCQRRSYERIVATITWTTKSFDVISRTHTKANHV